MRKVSLDLHDFSLIRSRFDLFLMIKDHYPNFKLSLFTIPFDYIYEMSGMNRVIKEEVIKQVNENKDWLEFIPHGLTHIPREFEKADRESTTTYTENVISEMVKSGIPEDRIVKGFGAPMWLWNQDVVDVLDEKGWWGAIDRNQPDMLKTKKTYTYTHSIAEPFWLSNQETLNLHGHMMLPDKNNLEDCLLRLFKLPLDSEWHFASEYVK
jgi:hypothetical protein